MSELANLTREELNERAARLGIADPASLPNKTAVVEAIEKAEATAGQPTSRTARHARMLRLRRRRGRL